MKGAEESKSSVDNNDTESEEDEEMNKLEGSVEAHHA